MGSCLGKEKKGGGIRHKVNADKSRFNLAMTDPDMGWRRSERDDRRAHVTNPNAYPCHGKWQIDGINTRTNERIQTDMISLAISAGNHALSIWNKYSAIGRLDEQIDVENNNGHDICSHFGIVANEWRLLERSRAFKCIEVNPLGVQGAGALAKCEMDNPTLNKDERQCNDVKLGDITSSGSQWKEGDLIQIMVHQITNAKFASLPDPKKDNTKRQFIIDSAEMGLNIIGFEKNIVMKNQPDKSFSDFVQAGAAGWTTDQTIALKDSRVAALKQQTVDSREGVHVFVISPEDEVFSFVPEELILSVTSRLQDAFMTQSAF